MIHALALLVVFISCIYASPIAFPQAVTAAIAPADSPPPGCTGTFPGVFGIAAVNISSSDQPSRVKGAQQAENSITQAPNPAITMAQISQVVDGQVQGGMHTVTLTPISQIADGQIQNPMVTMMPAEPSNPPAAPQQACRARYRRAESPVERAAPLTSTSLPTLEAEPSEAIRSSASSRAPAATPAPRLSLVSCQTNSTLRLSLSENNLLDSRNRTGYIASNYQFQFDGPAQSGAIYTSGWSVCDIEGGGAKLALGGNTTFFQCLSGSFYNLYTENWAAQCNPVELRVVGLVDCA